MNTPTKTLKRIRIAWKIGPDEGRGLPFPVSERKSLEEMCVFLNELYGPGTNWIEEIEL